MATGETNAGALHVFLAGLGFVATGPHTLFFPR